MIKPLNDLHLQRQPLSDGEGPADLRSVAAVIRCRREQEIYTQGDPAENAYRVVEGAAIRFNVGPNGRRLIVDFLLPGDFFGFADRDACTFTVQAINSGTVLTRYNWRKVNRLVSADTRIAWEICEAATQEITRLQARVLLLGRITSLGKVSGFLIEMAGRSRGGALQRIVLPMSRYDIADYLALSVETVSRAMTILKHRGAITLLGTRQVQIIDAAALGEVSDRDEIADSSGGGLRFAAGVAPGGAPT